MEEKGGAYEGENGKCLLYSVENMKKGRSRRKMKMKDTQ